MTTTPRKPKDRQPKATEQASTFEVTVRGVDLSIPAERFDDFELLFDMQTIDQGASDAEALPRLIDVFSRFLGIAGAKRLIAAAKADGPLGIAAGVALINEVFDALKGTSAPNS
ncbi:hypothetical protein MHY85_03105 [Cellulomonas sp. ACRRI]|uniref:hypothetical protein n=1 Tax=Cellulomonas sp. ACRRI TaxID=2918188 RepID=UPI001EF333F2|nr:hypothetical protein [Cellulomonas sp. ACRRI]MCG7284960.1 hypothetical protein [Cellulomonas sp. ACRRI]